MERFGTTDLPGPLNVIIQVQKECSFSKSDPRVISMRGEHGKAEKLNFQVSIESNKAVSKAIDRKKNNKNKQGKTEINT